ncbi:hypothetical protein ACIA8O_18495 [Kitasatospora sp. NPDC051853]|uniref:hypothetical protein n=1 Tax=Kitasatospora sp. NPDC051853 TaxID=3364058 RepID=UPI0037A83968
MESQPAVVPTYGMSNDFAAIICAVLAALLVVAALEAVNGFRDNRQRNEELLLEYAEPIRRTLLARSTGIPLPPAEQADVDKELQRFWIRKHSLQRIRMFAVLYMASSALLACGIAAAVRWAALKQPTAGYATAQFCLVAAGLSTVMLVAGLALRLSVDRRYRRHRLQIELSRQLGEPNATLAHRQFLDWTLEAGDGSIIEIAGQRFVHPWKSGRMSRAPLD